MKDKKKYDTKKPLATPIEVKLFCSDRPITSAVDVEPVELDRLQAL